MLKICLACSAGGHFTDIQQISEAYENFNHFFVTFKRVDTEGLKNVYYIEDPKRNPLSLIKNFFQSIRILLKESPDVIITTGAGVVVPFCYLSKFLKRTKIIYLELFCKIEKPSLTGRLLYPISDIFLVQWEELIEKYGRKAAFKGRVF